MLELNSSALTTCFVNLGYEFVRTNSIAWWSTTNGKKIQDNPHFERFKQAAPSREGAGEFELL